MLLEVGLGLFRVLLAGLLDGLDRGLGRILSVVDRRFSGLLSLVLDLVCDRADLPVLDVRRGHKHPGDEAHRDRA